MPFQYLNRSAASLQSHQTAAAMTGHNPQDKLHHCLPLTNRARSDSCGFKHQLFSRAFWQDRHLFVGFCHHRRSFRSLPGALSAIRKCGNWQDRTSHSNYHLHCGGSGSDPDLFLYFGQHVRALKPSNLRGISNISTWNTPHLMKRRWNSIKSIHSTLCAKDYHFILTGIASYTGWTHWPSWPWYLH